jgi:hypothetical protein
MKTPGNFRLGPIHAPFLAHGWGRASHVVSSAFFWDFAFELRRWGYGRFVGTRWHPNQLRDPDAKFQRPSKLPPDGLVH